MVKDAEVRVREALVMHLKESFAPPRGVALSRAAVGGWALSCTFLSSM